MTRDEKSGIPEYLHADIQAPFRIFSAKGFLSLFPHFFEIIQLHF